MSLVAWYPLNGNLNNYGVGDADFGNTEGFGQYHPAGVFGKGLKGPSKTLSWTAEQSVSLMNSREMSFAFWVYIDASTGDTTNRQMFFGEEGSPRIFSIFNFPSCNDVHLSWQNTSTGRWITTGVASGVLPSYEWTHVCVVYKNPNITLYINGQPTANDWGSGDYTGENFSRTIPVLYQHNSRILNDFRVYNHALSLNEVHEIAKARVLHMLFNDPLLDTRNVNQLNWLVPKQLSENGWSGNAQIAPNYDGWIFTATNGWRTFGWNVPAALVGQPCAFMFDYKILEDAANARSLWVNTHSSASWGANVGNLDPTFDHKWRTFRKIITPQQWLGILLRGKDNGGKNYTIQVRNVKLSAAPFVDGYSIFGDTTTKVLDYSGFQWNGQGTNLQLVDEGNGLYPIHCAGVASRKVYIQNFPHIHYNITYNTWIKRTSDSPNSYEFILSHGRDIDRFGLSIGLVNKKPHVWIGVNTPKNFHVEIDTVLPLNEWHMLTVTYDRRECNLYLDGGNRTTVAVSGDLDYSQSDNALVIGKMSYLYYNNDYYFPFHGEILQADVYATALSYVDVLRLYYARKIVDRGANITTRLVSEAASGDVSQLTRQGILKTNGLNEIFVDNDGRVWCPILYHNNYDGTNLFSSQDNFDKFVYHNEDCWANFPLMKHYGGVGGVWRIREYQELQNRPIELFSWTQTANPFTATFADVAPANTSERSVNLDGRYGGIYVMRGNTYMVQHNGTNGNWHGALGCYSAHQGGIPGINNQICFGITALYVEVDPSILTAKQYRGGVDYAREFKEE